MLYQGQQQDPESNLYYLRARYYDPATGRFISRDPVKGYLTNPQTQNGYNYALNNPINLSDPSGENPLAACAEALCKDGDCTNELRAVPVIATTVYRAVVDGITKYVGITNDFSRRAAEHLSNSGRVIQPILDVPSRPEARAVEQVLINNYGLTNLDNKINSISPNNPIYDQALKTGSELLKPYGL